jgi:hypothetical protein
MVFRLAVPSGASNTAGSARGGVPYIGGTSPVAILARGVLMPLTDEPQPHRLRQSGWIHRHPSVKAVTVMVNPMTASRAYEASGRL